MVSKSLRAVTYLRKSTDRQEASIPDQRDAVAKLAQQRGYTIVREYKDEGISGDDTERRVEFLRMLDDAKKVGDFDCVLCWDQDRFGRFDPLEAGYWVKPLRERGVYLETVAQGQIDWEDFAGRIIYTVQQEGKHAYLRDLSRNTTRGLLAKAKRGEWVNGPPPYAYRLNGHKRLEPGDPAEVETVRWLYREYLGRDVSCAALAAELNDRGHPSPGGKLWSGPAVHTILTRTVYIGDSTWNRRRVGRYNEFADGEIRKVVQRKARRSGAADVVLVENTHAALVDRATADRVRKKLSARADSTTPHVGGGDFLFTGLLRCGHCGWPMHGVIQSAKGADGKVYRYRRYMCGKYNLHRRHGCKCNRVLEREILDIILRAVEKTFLAPANLKRLRAEIRRQETAERAGQEAPAADLDRRLAALDAKIKTGTERWLTAPPNLTGLLGETLEQWRREREELHERRRELAKPAASTGNLDAAIERITAGLATLRDHMAEAPVAEQREVLRQMVEKVELWFTHSAYGPKRERAVLDNGLIYLREDLVLCRPVSHKHKQPTGMQTSAQANGLYVIAFNVADYHILTPAEDKRQRVTAVLTAHPEWSDRRVCRETGVHPSTVSQVRQRLEQSGAIPQGGAREDSWGRRRRRPSDGRRARDRMTFTVAAPRR